MAEQASKEKETVQGEGSDASKAKKGKMGLFILIGAMGLFLVLGAVFFLILPQGMNPVKKGGDSTKETRTEPVVQGHIYSLESMIVNLADMDFPRYLKIKIDFESVAPKPHEEFDRRLPQLKDLILTLLTSKTYPEISDSNGKMKLKEEIIEKANGLFDTVKLKTVYFTEFVVQ